MITDAILDWFQNAATWLIGALPDSAFNPATYGDPVAALQGVQAQGQAVLSGGPGFIFNGPLFVAMVASWCAVELGIFTVRGLVWVKKALLV